MSPHRIELRVFGVMRKVSDDEGYFRFPLKGDASIGSVRELKRVIKEWLLESHPGFDSGLVDECAIADEAQVLTEDAVLTGLQGLAVLPPVCGG